MLLRALKLFRISWTSVYHRLRHDLGREIVVGISTVVLGATFFYVFNDFLNVQVKTLSESLRDSFGEWLSYALLGVAAAFCGRRISRDLKDHQSVSTAARYLGESAAGVRTFRALYYTSLIAILHGFGWWLTYRYLFSWPRTQACMIEGVMLLITVTVAVFPTGKRDEKRTGKDVTIKVDQGSTKAALFRWRWRQMNRGRLTRLSYAAGIIMQVFGGYAAMSGVPVFACAAAAFAGGLFWSMSMCFQAADDLEYAWAERAMGVTHDEFMGGYYRVAAVIALLSATIGSVALFKHGAEAALQGGVVAAIPALLAPFVLFQIDARRPAISIMSLLIVSLFIATAVLAHWLSLALLPIVYYYAKGAQDGRFYRA